MLTSRGKACVVMLGSEPVRAYRPMNLHLVVGDTVSLAKRPDGSIWISGVGERRTHLSRPDPHNPREQRIMAANIEVAVHVSTPMSPPLRPALIDRFLVAILNGGTRPVIAINKVDLLTAAQRKFIDEELEDYMLLEVPLVFCSAKTGDGIEELRGILRGKLSVLVGHSGVGKSSLLNALHPVVSARVGDVQERSGRGRHTTSFAAMFDLGDGTRIIDTPGVREFGLWDMDRTQLRFYFREFEPFALECRFSNCTHLHEPACAVKDAVERGEISERRYEAYENLVSQMAL